MGFTKIFNSIRSSTMLPSDIENVSLKRIIPKINEWNIDTVLITANRNLWRDFLNFPYFSRLSAS